MYEEKDVLTIEVLLLNKLQILFDSMNQRDEQQFDENTELIEMLFSQDQETKDELLDYKKKLGIGLTATVDEIKRDSVNCKTPISKKTFISVNKYRLEWLFRKDYLSKIIEVYGQRDILQFRKPVTAKIATLAPPSAEIKDIKDIESEVDVKTRNVGKENTPENPQP